MFVLPEAQTYFHTSRSRRVLEHWMLAALIRECVVTMYGPQCIERSSVFLTRAVCIRYTREPPKITRPRPNVVIRLSNIECDFRRPIDDPSSSVNAAFAADLQVRDEHTRVDINTLFVVGVYVTLY